MEIENNITEQGIIALRKRNFYQAEKLLKDALKTEQHPHTKLALCIALIYLGKRTEALEYACNLSDNVAIDEKSLFTLINYIHQTGNRQLLEKLLPQIKHHLSNPGFLCSLALCFRNNGTHDIAFQYFSKMEESQNHIIILYILDMIDNIYPNKDIKFLIMTLHNSVKVGIDGDWLTYQLARYKDITQHLDKLLPQPATPVSMRKIDFFPFMFRNGRELLPNEKTDKNIQLLSLPGLKRLSFEENIKSFADMVVTAAQQESVKIILANINAVRNTFAQECKDPIQVISSGRAGTTALFDLLAKTTNLEPFHSFTMQTTPMERVELLTRIRSGDFNQNYVNIITSQYLKIRSSEIIYAYRNNKTPVIINHWDSIFSLVTASLFPKARLLYLERDTQNCVNSFIGKLQWQYAQLMDVPYAILEDNDQFIYKIDTDHNIGQKIAWYLFVTKALANGIATILPTQSQFLSLKADDLFKGNENTISSLTKFIGITDISTKDIALHYKTPINAKEKNQQDEPLWMQSEIDSAVLKFKELCEEYY